MNFNVDLVARSPMESLIASLDVPVVIIGIHAAVTSANGPAKALICGEGPTSIIGTYLQDLLHPQFRETDLAWFDTAIATNASVDASATVHFLHASGYGTWSVKPLHDEYGNNAGFVCQSSALASDSSEVPDVPKAPDHFEIEADIQVLGLPVQNELRWQTAVLSANQGVWDHDFERDRHYLSDAWRSMRGLEAHEPVPEKTEDWLLTIHPDDLLKIKHQLHLQDTGATDVVNYSFRQRHADGHWIWILSRGRVVRRDAAGRPVHIIGTDTDITEMKMVEDECIRLAERLSLAMEAADMGQWEFDIDSDKTTWGQRNLEMFGLSDGPADSIQSHWTELVHPDDRDAMIAHNAACVRDRRDIAYDYRVLTADGSERYIRTRGKYVPTSEGSGRYIGVDIDLTPDYLKTVALEEVRERLEYDSRHDALTGLANRRYLDDILDRRLAACTNSDLAAMHFDVDRFKQINDSLGHDAGDKTLQHIAAILIRHMPANVVVARVGGDEFVALFTDAPTDRDLISTAHRITCALSAPLAYGDAQIKACVSIGMARIDGSDTTPRNLFVNADMALYHAKKDNYAAWRMYCPKMRAEAAHRKTLEDALTTAFEQGQIICHYQPQFHAKTLDLIGLEALVRWRCPTRGLVMPDQFLSVVSDMGLIAKLDALVLRQALYDRSIWAQAGLTVPRISVNISSQRLTDPELGAHLRALNIMPGAIVFELLESVFLEGEDKTIDENLKVIAAMGIDIEIDDFGTGHASIISLLRISPKRLKIDRALVQPIVSDTKRRALLETIIRIGKMLDIAVVAEGVETAAHISILQDMNCDYLQGYALARPMDATSLMDLMAARQSVRRDRAELP